MPCSENLLPFPRALWAKAVPANDSEKEPAEMLFKSGSPLYRDGERITFCGIPEGEITEYYFCLSFSDLVLPKETIERFCSLS